jgi:glycosyltransferase involved in cell wall biosynthesis
MQATPISVVIPAHNEAAVIARCLSHLTRGARPGELDVIVVCNGCSDETAEIARSFAPTVRVLESPVAGKPAALNLGDENARGFPRFFVDADIVLPLADLRKVAEVLRQGQIHGAAPRMEVDLASRPWPVRAFYEIWLRTPYVQGEMLGCGVYAISEEGRRRFDRFPQIIADDCFVRLLFAPGERRCVQEATFRMTPPETLRQLIHINVRRQVGMEEMADRYPQATTDERGEQRRALLRLLRQPGLWPALAVYLYAKLATLALHRWKRLRGRQREWNRDDSSRRTA